MVSVTIGLRDKELLKWFNQIHAALQRAEADYIQAAATDLVEKGKDPQGRPAGTLINAKLVVGGKTIATPRAIAKYKQANAGLIGVLQAVIKEIQQVSAFDDRASRWMAPRK